MKFHGAPPEAPPPLPPVHHNAIAPQPERAVRRCVAHGVQQVLVQWKGQSSASATWEDVESFRARYPAFQLEDELPLEEGRDVMSGRYGRIGVVGHGMCDAQRAQRVRVKKKSRQVAKMENRDSFLL
jgi:hypothetical protein